MVFLVTLLPFPADVVGVFNGWQIELIFFLIVAFVPVWQAPKWMKKQILIFISFFIVGAIFGPVFIVELFVAFAAYYFFTEVLHTQFGDSWKPIHRVYLSFALLLVMILIDSTLVPLYHIAHWAGIAYGIPRLVDWTASRVENRLEKHGFVDFLAYMFYFPSFMQGPIARSEHFVANISNKPNTHDLLLGIYRIFTGYMKYLVGVFLFSSRPPGFFTKQVVAAPWELALFLLLTPIIGYLFFAAYTDTARGVSSILGYELPPNFDNPFATVSFRKFWRKYHISFTSWLRDYIYIPLGGSARGRLLTIVNVFVVFLFVALWHNVSYNFLIWGMTQALAVAAEQMLGSMKLFSYRFWLPIKFVFFWIWQAFSWSFFYGGFDGALVMWGRLLLAALGITNV